MGMLDDLFDDALKTLKETEKNNEDGKKEEKEVSSNDEKDVGKEEKPDGGTMDNETSNNNVLFSYGDDFKKFCDDIGCPLKG